LPADPIHFRVIGSFVVPSIIKGRVGKREIEEVKTSDFKGGCIHLNNIGCANQKINPAQSVLPVNDFF
jgi:hypothetical protein